jgi:hypothetical protein
VKEKKYAVSLVFTRAKMSGVIVAQFLTLVTAESEAAAIQRARIQAFDENEVLLSMKSHFEAALEVQ